MVSLTSQAMPMISRTDAISAVGNVPVSLLPSTLSETLILNMVERLQILYYVI